MSDPFEEKRRRMVERLRYELNISDKVAKAMLKVPRHLFVPKRYEKEAYVDTPLPIGSGQTISAPHMVAIMCDLLDLNSSSESWQLRESSLGLPKNFEIAGSNFFRRLDRRKLLSDNCIN